ncbi:hypothetical protein [uncultured Gammaproteobacteria bacterium]|nr:hypothetical protein [uncultured Gammaproteobacteria bacterium]
MKDKTLDSKTGNAVIKAIGFGKSGEAAINYMHSKMLKGVTLYTSVDTDTNAQINDGDLLFLIFDEKDSKALNDFMRIAKISNERNILTIALIKTEQSDVMAELKEIVDSFIVLPETSAVISNKYIFDVIQRDLCKITQLSLQNPIF